MGKFGSPHKLCIIRTLEFVYFSFFGVTLLLEVPINCILLERWYGIFFLFWGACHVCSMGKFGGPHKLCILRTLEFVYFSFLLGHSARAQWVNLEVPINCVLLEHCNLYIFPFLGGMPCVLHG